MTPFSGTHCISFEVFEWALSQISPELHDQLGILLLRAPRMHLDGNEARMPIIRIKIVEYPDMINCFPVAIQLAKVTQVFIQLLILAVYV